jgi:hypothetical protein
MHDKAGTHTSQRSRHTGRVRRAEQHYVPAPREGEAGRWMQHLLELPCTRMDRVAQARDMIAQPSFNLDSEFAQAMEVLIAQELDA